MEITMMIGKVLHHNKYGYGVGWRSDKFNRVSVKFESGKEVGGFNPADLRSVEKEEFEKEGVLGKLKSAGLDAYIDMKAEEAAAHAKVDDIEINKNFFERLFKDTKALKSKGAPVNEIVNRQLEILQESNLDNFSRSKISKRLSKMNDVDRLEKYVGNSYLRYRKMDEERSLLKLNIMLTGLLNKLKGKNNG
jgi:hypothetical protein